MNRVLNDLGDWVISVGSPGSRENLTARHPKLIESLVVYFHDTPVSTIIAKDLEDRGFDRSDARTIAEVVRQRCCSTCLVKDIKPSHFGSVRCESGSIASGGTKSHCSCDICF